MMHIDEHRLRELLWHTEQRIIARIDESHRSVLQSVRRHSHHEEDHIMADLSALQAAVDGLATDEHAAAAELQNLAAQVQALTAGSVTQEQIDSITSSVTAVAQQLQADTADDGTPPATPPPPPDQPPPDQPPTV